MQERDNLSPEYPLLMPLILLLSPARALQLGMPSLQHLLSHRQQSTLNFQLPSYQGLQFLSLLEIRLDSNYQHMEKDSSKIQQLAK